MTKRRSATQSADFGVWGSKRLRLVQLPAPETAAGIPRTVGFTWRISKIPGSVTEAEFLRTLNNLPCSPDVIDSGQNNVVRWSFAQAAASADTERFKTATVTFGTVPTQFQTTSNPMTIDLIGNAEPVTIDSHFHGLTPLNNPSGPPTVEYV